MARRNAVNCIPGFNMVILDVDDGFNLETVKLLMEDYRYLIYTTKRHTDKQNRFRILFPLSHKIKLNPKDYKEFMDNLYDWLPFDVDRQTNDIARKWLSHANKKSPAIYNEGQLLDALLFIPKTKKAEIQQDRVNQYSNLSGLERWFLKETHTGNRSNQFIKYGYMLVDAGQSFDEIKNRVLTFNSKLKDGLTEMEILSTIMVSVQSKIHNRDTA